MPTQAATEQRASWPKLLQASAAGVLAFAAGQALFGNAQATLIGMLTLLVVLWTNEGLPLGAVSLLPLILFPALGIADMPAVASSYANPIIFLFIGGFMLAIAVETTGLHKQIAYRILAVFPHTARGMIFALALVSGLLSTFLSNTTTTLLLMPLAMFLTDQRRLNVRFALAIAYGASIGGVITPIGTPPNLILLGFLGQHGLAAPTFVQWVALVSPLALAMFLVMGTLLSFGLGGNKVDAPETSGRLDPAQRRLALTLLALLVLLLANSPVRPLYPGLGLDERAILLAFGLSTLLPGFGVLTWQDCRRIPYEIVLLFGAGFAIAHAFDTTGLADASGSLLMALTELDLWLLLLAIALLVTFATEITSNTALIAMMLPVVYALTGSGAIDPILFLLVATICSSYAFMLPIATPPNAIAVASGAVRPSDMLRFGLLLNLCASLLITAFALAYWQYVL
ncbi:MAG: sodium:proton antiporter [Gammaproteobacteria bacterium]|nr:sodium:proton antiporter [Gammaproteobacteria bacterium]